MIIAYIDAYRDEFGVEPICGVLTANECQIAPSTYYASKTRPPSARAISDAYWLPILMALWIANRKVYGSHKRQRPVAWWGSRRDARCGQLAIAS